MKLLTAVLFDIDGTLVDMRGAGRRSFILALKSAFGWDDDIPYVNFAGNTDLNVLQQVAEHHRVTLSRQDQRRFFREMTAHLRQTVAETGQAAYPGVRELLETLSARPDVVLGLVTGNVAEAARIKLEPLGLHHHFVLGAFGDEHADRLDIARLALRRIENRLREHQRIRALFLIGDTPHDVLAARAIAAVSIGVATGKFTEAQLHEAGADHVLSDLSDTARVLGLLSL